MSPSVIMTKHGVYGNAVQVVCNEHNNRASWLLTTVWPSEAVNLRRQYLIRANTIPDVTDGAGPSHAITVHLVDHTGQGGRQFSARDLYEGTVETYAPPSVVVQFVATDVETTMLTNMLIDECLDGSLYPGEPKASDWQIRAHWIEVTERIIDSMHTIFVDAR